MKEIFEIIAEETGVKPEYVKNVIALMDEGSTIPFIARYRKEVHGSLDDVMLRKIAERLSYLRNLNERKIAVKTSIEEQGKLTGDLAEAIDNAETQAELEDLYRPYKQKRATRASKAREKGLEGLTLFLMLQSGKDPKKEAEKYVDAEKGVADADEALAGAMDIIAENISDDAGNRDVIRKLIRSKGMLVSEAVKDEESVYDGYYDFSVEIKKVKGHQILAINRGEKEGYLKAGIEIDHDEAKRKLKQRLGIKNSPSSEYLESACDDSYRRLIWPSLEREIRNELTGDACDGAIANFALNLKPLLMQPPVKGHVTMGLDPGYSHGCKVAVVDENGKVLDTAVVFPTFGEAKKAAAIRELSAMIRKHGVTHIAIGNGTASRETESMAAEMILGLNTPEGKKDRREDMNVSYAIVNEAGASVYSASKLGSEEFPEYDVNIRSAISIARRLQDPLAELVKIDPMSIGVGQYQHDMPANQLEATLSGVVEDCVNMVGVDVNSASAALLSRVSGLTGVISKNIVKYREENGAFSSRKELLKVSKLGPKTFELCAGFLRVPESNDILDNTGVHPESYGAAEKLLEICGYERSDVAEKNLEDIKGRIDRIGKEKIASMCNVGIPTLEDIVSELIKPGRDPRDELPPVLLRKDVMKIEDLKPGMKLKGTVRNVIDFGVFVDIGVHQDGLVHISKICDRFIRHPSEVVKVGDPVDVTVLSVDIKKHKISLSMKD